MRASIDPKSGVLHNEIRKQRIRRRLRGAFTILTLVLRIRDPATSYSERHVDCQPLAIGLNGHTEDGVRRLGCRIDVTFTNALQLGAVVMFEMSTVRGEALLLP